MQKVEGSNPFSRFFALQIDAFIDLRSWVFRVPSGTRILYQERISRQFRALVPETKPFAS
jgi:hypothetical protein